MAWIIVLAVAALLAFLAIVIRAGLVRLHDAVRQSWTLLDTLLIRRHDLLPGLVDLCARHMQYEEEILKRVPQAGTAVLQAAARKDIPALGAADSVLRHSASRLIALTENYPRLRADPAFLELRERLMQIDASIADHREIYNSAVNLLNVRCQAFPHCLVARATGFRQAALLE